MMTDFEKQAYASMKSEDRVFLWLAKVAEFIEFQSIMTDEDAQRMKRVYEILKEAAHD